MDMTDVAIVLTDEEASPESGAILALFTLLLAAVENRWKLSKLFLWVIPEP